MHLSSRDVRSEQGRKVQCTLYARKCRTSAGLAEKVMDHGNELAQARPDGGQGTTKCSVETPWIIVAKLRIRRLRRGARLRPFGTKLPACVVCSATSRRTRSKISCK